MSSLTVNSLTSNGNPTGTPATALGTEVATRRINVLNAGAASVWIHRDATGTPPSCQIVHDQGVPIFAPNAAGIEVPFVLEDPVYGTALGEWWIATDPGSLLASASVRVE